MNIPALFNKGNHVSTFDVNTRAQIEYQRKNRIEPPGDLPSNLKLVVVIPAYNEARFIGSTVLKALDFSDYVLVVDDGSDDDTSQIAEAAGASVVRHEFNLGKGAALNSGLRECRQLGAQCVVTMDADGQHLPEEMQQVVAPILEERADLVIGSRYLKIGNQVPRHRIWGHRAFNLLTKWGSGIQVSDSQCGYRAFSARALEAIYFTSRGFSVESEMQFLVRENGLKVEEVPVTIRYQDQPKRSVMLHGLLVLNGVLRLVGQHRPLFYLGVPGAFFLTIGISWGLWVMDIYRRSAQLAVGYTLISLLFSMTGMIMLTTGITLHSIRGLLMDMLSSKKESDHGIG
jgi:glycosyltransferase involved in cell wall biosynthesis